MKDRIPTYPGRVILTPVSGVANAYDMELGDVPSQEGTPLNRDSLLQNDTAASLNLGEDATPDDALKEIIKLLTTATTNISSLTKDFSNTVPVAKGGTGQISEAKAIYALINGLSALTNSTISGSDYFAVDDVDAATGKKITLESLLAYIRTNLISYGTSDLTAGSSSLATGKIYLKYE